MLLCAAMKVSQEEDFIKIINLVRIKPEIKELMEGVIKSMNQNEEFVGRYHDWKEENDRINQAIIKEEKAESFKEGIKQGITQGIAQGMQQASLKDAKNLLKNGVSFEVIQASIEGLTNADLQKIYNEVKASKENDQKN